MAAPVPPSPAFPEPGSKRHEEFRACLILRHARGVGPRTWFRLLEHFGSARAAVSAVGSWVPLGLARQGQAGTVRRDGWSEGAREEFDAATALNRRILLYCDPDYPERLRHIPDPPLFLYCLGDTSLLHGPCVAVVGSRRGTPHGLHAARSFGRGLSASGVTVVSGMAAGVDREAHLGAMEGPGGTVAVWGTGLDVAYPRSNRELARDIARHGLIVTEFAPGTAPEPRNFPRRNRIISGLSLGVVLTQAAARSGGRITCRLALEQGRDVWVVAGPDPDAEMFAGCRELADDGARVVSRASEVVLDLEGEVRAWLADNQPREDASAPKSLDRDGGEDADELAFLDVLRGVDCLHVDELGRRLDWDSPRVSRVALGLELKGLVRQWPGMNYGLA